MKRPRAEKKPTPDHYKDLDLAIKELGTIWVLDKINAALFNAKRARLLLEAKIATKEEHPQ